MFKFKPYSSALLAFEGVLLIIMGLYFVFFRPALLPEDSHYMQSSYLEIEKGVPHLDRWLHKVFWVLGSYIFTTGVLILYVSLTSFRLRLYGAFYVVAFAGITSIGSMTYVNFIIESDFKWILLIFTIPWLLALLFYRINK